MSVTYPYTFAQFVSLDASLTEPNGTILASEIATAGLVGLENIIIDPFAQTVDITFSSAIAVPTLDAVVAAHTGLSGGVSPGGDEILTPDLWREVQYTPTLGQVTYILPSAPAAVQPVEFLVNGQDSTQDDDFIVSGKTVTWLNNKFSIAADDDVVIKYWEDT